MCKRSLSCKDILNALLHTSQECVCLHLTKVKNLLLWLMCFLLRYADQKQFTFRFPDKCEWQNGFNPDNKGGLVWFREGSKTNKGTGAGVNSWLKKGL